MKQAIYFNDFKNSYIPHILKEIYLDRVYDSYLAGRKDLIIADIGGNIGLTSYYFKDYAKQVYTLEPSLEHFKTMTDMFKFNKIKNITPLQLALADKDGEMTFNHNTNVTMFSLKKEINDKGETETVKTVTMETLINDYIKEDIDLMKLDTEGYEAEIVASEAFGRVAHRIKLIIGEYHSWASANPNIFASALRDRGFEFGWMQGTEASLFVAKRV